MTRFPGDFHAVRVALLLAMMLPVCTVPSFSQMTRTETESAEARNQAQIEADTKRLLQLATELRAEVGRTYKESLSLAVIKKAEEVEKLATSLKNRMSKEAVNGH